MAPLHGDYQRALQFPARLSRILLGERKSQRGLYGTCTVSDIPHFRAISQPQGWRGSEELL